MSLINFMDGNHFTFNELINLKQSKKVIRTAHPGNFDLVTVFIAEYFEVILREDIITGADIYQPEFIISNLQKKRISESRLTAGVFSLKVNKRNDYVIAHHYKELVKKFPYIKKGVEEVIKLPNLFHILNNLTINKPDEFDRYYDNDGIQYKLYESSIICNLYKNINGDIVSVPNNQIIDLYRRHIKKLLSAYENSKEKTNYESLDISNNLFHVILLLNQIQHNKSGDIYHLCGSRMYEYLYKDSRFSTTNQKNINNLFSIIYGNSKIDLNFFLIPTKQFKNFIKIKKYGNEYFSVYELLEILKEFIKKESLNSLNINELRLKREVVSILLQNNIYTQYDINTNDEGIKKYLEIPNEFMDTSFKELERINKSCESLLLRVKKYQYNISHL